MRVVVAGGGVAGLETVIALRALAEDAVDIELLSPEPYFWYRPLAAALPFAPVEREHFDLSRLADDLGIALTLDSLRSVDREAHLAETVHGATFEYDVLVLAHGTFPSAAVEGATTFRGPGDVDAFIRILRDLELGVARRLVLAIPAAATWPLPAYELALQASAYLRERDAECELAIVTAEDRPLGLFGGAASNEVAALLVSAGVELLTNVHPVGIDGGRLQLAPARSVEFDRLVALPRLRAVPVEGIPLDQQGFVPVDEFGRVEGIDDVFAAGDATSFPIKQGGIAAQQADAVASTIAAKAGAPIRPQPFRPVLRAVLLTGGAPVYLRAEPVAPGDVSSFDEEPPWWPPAKIFGRYLAPFLAARVQA